MAKKKDEPTADEPAEAITEAAEPEPEPELDQWARNLEVRPNPPGTV